MHMVFIHFLSLRVFHSMDEIHSYFPAGGIYVALSEKKNSLMHRAFPTDFTGRAIGFAPGVPWH